MNNLPRPIAMRAQCSRFMSTFFIVLGICSLSFISLLVEGAFKAPLLADACSFCMADKAGGCDRYCENVPSGKLECHQFCMRRACGEVCGPGGDETSNAVADEVTDCRTCVEYMARNACTVDCRRSERKGECIRRCAKFKCSNRCNLPVGTQSEPRRQPRMGCLECKERATGGCRRSCGDKNRAGFTACEVSCVEKKCFRTCNKHLF